MAVINYICLMRNTSIESMNEDRVKPGKQIKIIELCISNTIVKYPAGSGIFSDNGWWKPTMCTILVTKWRRIESQIRTPDDWHILQNMMQEPCNPFSGSIKLEYENHAVMSTIQIYLNAQCSTNHWFLLYLFVYTGVYCITLAA